MKDANLSRIKKYILNSIDSTNNAPLTAINNPIARGKREGYKNAINEFGQDLINLINKIEEE
jgi:hypothetical protein